ncbi:helix-turn-helix transcriptional regulator [Streptomyces sp. NBC_01267]|uniref:helix-turn-helix domain-containing protein n=1 Tax=unclassified Streptomyces TaxID=2593676 RepID=UPI002E33023C|nr:helix-turn-helix transcriptional regulator [Streptomyces sp. NBC_01267]
MSIRSQSGPARPARSAPCVDTDRATRCTEAVRDIAEDLTALSEELMQSAYGIATPTTELLDRVVAIKSLTQEAIGALVVRQRSQGEPLGELAEILERTEDRLRKKYNPHIVDQALTSRHRPRRTTPDNQTAADLPDTPNPLRQPRQRLASALTLMWNGSHISQRELADRMKIHPSYVSRILSGQRDVSWQHVKAISDTCGGNSALMKPLWETAARVRPSAAEPVQALRTYLQALHYAAGSPSDETLLASAQHITATELRQALDGPGVPVWQVVARLTTVLHGLPDTIRPLWRQAHANAETSTLNAQVRRQARASAKISTLRAESF